MRESPWKHQLNRTLLDFRKLPEKTGRVHDEVSLEKFFFVSAFLMRKLWERLELTNDIDETEFAVKKYACIRKPPPIHFWVRDKEGRVWQPIEDHYELDEPKDATLSFVQLCNQVIHSYVFVARPKEGEVFLCSKRFFEKVLYRIEVTRYLELIERVYYDEIGWENYNMATGHSERRGFGWNEKDLSYS